MADKTKAMQGGGSYVVCPTTGEVTRRDAAAEASEASQASGKPAAVAPQADMPTKKRKE